MSSHAKYVGTGYDSTVFSAASARESMMHSPVVQPVLHTGPSELPAN
jgi:hypothetical protein